MKLISEYLKGDRMIGIDKNYLILDKNPIDHRWKVLSDTMAIGDGVTPADAIASARMLTDEPIFEYSFHDGQYHQIDETVLEEESFIADGEAHYEKFAFLGDDF